MISILAPVTCPSFAEVQNILSDLDLILHLALKYSPAFIKEMTADPNFANNKLNELVHRKKCIN